MEQEMASKLEIPGGDKSSSADKDSIKTIETQQMLDAADEVTTINSSQPKLTEPKVVEPDELRESYDQYNDDPNFNNRQREYYSQR